MRHEEVLGRLTARFRQRFGAPPKTVAYAPGRVEILGNHTDYNEGLVLSAAINRGTYFALRPAPAGNTCRLIAGDVGEEAVFDVTRIERSPDVPWANYVLGVLAGLARENPLAFGFEAMFLGDVPLGAGLSSSAALEMSAALAVCDLYGLAVDKLELARIGQAAEHDFAGANCGLLDQMTSLFGQQDRLVASDFRSLAVHDVPLGNDAGFLMCNTHAAHALVDGAYNERRRRCEEAARFFDRTLSHPVRALRDVSWDEWERHREAMDPVTARRAAHVIGENQRVTEGRDRLARGDLAGFGRLMFDSHESSRTHFENSCPELDVVVNAARATPGVLGARLSGGGFGGSAVVLLHPRDTDAVAASIAAIYEQQLGSRCDIRALRPSDGARIVNLSGDPAGEGGAKGTA